MSNIIFDVDGTIWDSSEEIAEVYSEVVRRQLKKDTFHITGKDIKRNLGKSMDPFMKGIFPMLSDNERTIIASQCVQSANEFLAEHPAPMFDGVMDTFRELSKNNRLYIVSNCGIGYIEAMMKGTGLTPFITDHLSNGVTGKSKGDNIRILMERNHIEHAVYVGDTQGDYEACLHAQIPFIWAKYGFGNVPDAKYEVSSITELVYYPFETLI